MKWRNQTCDVLTLSRLRFCSLNIAACWRNSNNLRFLSQCLYFKTTIHCYWSLFSLSPNSNGQRVVLKKVHSSPASVFVISHRELSARWNCPRPDLFTQSYSRCGYITHVSSVFFLYCVSSTCRVILLVIVEINKMKQTKKYSSRLLFFFLI